ncbi:unnamed protein product [Schistocephalus solidus]|uniref:Kunitz/Bovine pancreatic trypsin inhibitor domain protein n=1 Tax=Schistocephalus solidus TaxID=70667 RepID=A0A183TF75_SCHSO|nr:unnamed protein product [Schistocephalus solidus]
MPVETGRCRGFFPSFAYVPEMGRCIKFVYGGCGGNHNRFQSLDQCERACADRSEGPSPARDRRCLLPIETGNCLAYFPHYAFDRKLKKCVRFIYGGCGGNANKFSSMRECRSVCE